MRVANQIPPISGVFIQTSTKTTTYTAQVGELVPVDPSGAGFTVNLAAITAANKDGMICIKNITSSTNVVTLDGNGAQTIDGSATFSMNIGFQSIWLVSDGSSNWMVI